MDKAASEARGAGEERAEEERTAEEAELEEAKKGELTTPSEEALVACLRLALALFGSGSSLYWG